MDIFAGKNGSVLMVQVKSGKAHASKTEKEILKTWGKAFAVELKFGDSEKANR